MIIIKSMELTKRQITDAGVTQQVLAKALGVTQGRISQLPVDEPLDDKFQYRLRKEKVIRRKTLRWIKKNEQ